MSIYKSSLCIYTVVIGFCQSFLSAYQLATVSWSNTLLILFRMVRNYKRKTERANWTEEQMKLAILAVENKDLSIRQAAVVHGVPKDSLNRRVNGKLKSLSKDERHKNVLGRYRAKYSRMTKRMILKSIIIIKMD